MDTCGSESTSGSDSEPRFDSQGELAEWMSVLLGHMRTIVGHAARLAQVRRDRMQHRLRMMIAYGAIGLLAGLVIVCIGVAGVVFLARGLCAGLTVLFDGRLWLGELLTGAILLGGLAATAIVGLRLHERRDLRRMKAKYGIDIRPSTAS